MRLTALRGGETLDEMNGYVEKKKVLRRIGAALILLIALGLSACAKTPDGPGAHEVPADEDVPRASAHSALPSPEKAGYRAPEFADVVFDAEKAEGNDQVKIDLSHGSEGYVAVSALSEKRLKFQVIREEITYTYDLKGDGTPGVFPLQSGDGAYTVRVMENIEGTKYACLYKTEMQVMLADEFQPFLRPSNYVNYTKESDCVRKAQELSDGAQDALGVVSAVYDFVCAGVRYDYEKAETVQSGYLPDPDETMRTGKGICFDYASLGAAMLRSQGIPTKLIFGYVSPNDIYHAWNMFYTDQTGWVTVHFQVHKDSWNRLDLTFSAGGTNAQFIGDGGNYADVYCY